MLPIHIRKPAFGEAFASRLLAYAIENERRFEAAKIYDSETGPAIDPRTRVSMCLVDLGPLKNEIRGRLSDLAPALVAELGIKPFDLAEIEVEMVAHGDGAHFQAHIDTLRNEGGTQRLMTAVYYFHQKPRKFDGGALRVISLGPKDGEPAYRDIVPEHDALVTFPSWLPHEVRRVACPSGRFEDCRFALNAWFARRQPSDDPVTLRQEGKW